MKLEASVTQKEHYLYRCIKQPHVTGRVFPLGFRVGEGAQLPTLAGFWLAQSSTNTDIGTASATFIPCGWMYQTLWWCKWPCKKQLLHWTSNHESWDSNLVLLIPVQLKKTDNHTPQLAPRFNTPLPKPEKINPLGFESSYFPILGSFAKLLLLYCKRIAFHSCQTNKRCHEVAAPKNKSRGEKATSERCLEEMGQHGGCCARDSPGHCAKTHETELRKSFPHQNKFPLEWPRGFCCKNPNAFSLIF